MGRGSGGGEVLEGEGRDAVSVLPNSREAEATTEPDAHL